MYKIYFQYSNGVCTDITYRFRDHYSLKSAYYTMVLFWSDLKANHTPAVADGRYIVKYNDTVVMQSPIIK